MPFIGIFFLAFSIVLTAIASEFLLRGFSDFVVKVKMKGIFASLVILGLATVIPELMDAIVASYMRVGEMGIAASIGSCPLNLLLILGICFLVKPTRFNDEEFDLSLFGFMATFIFLLFCLDTKLTRFDSFFLLLLYVSFVWYILRKEVKRKGRIRLRELALDFLFIIFSLFTIVIGAYICISSALHVMDEFGVSAEWIGFTILAIGTSLPELTLSVFSAIKRKVEFAIGDIIGANIAHVSLLPGLAAAISPINLSPAILYSTLFYAFSLLLLSFYGRQRKVSYVEGILMISTYLIYLSLVAL